MTNNREETAMSEEVELEACAHCSGKAEMDSMQGFISLSTNLLEHRCAVYCLNCSVQVSVCYGDVPEMSDGEVISHVSGIWNQRPTTDPAKDVEERLQAYLNIRDNFNERNDVVVIANDVPLLASDIAALLQSTAAQSQLIGELEAQVERSNVFLKATQKGIACDKQIRADVIDTNDAAIAKVTAWREGK